MALDELYKVGHEYLKRISFVADKCQETYKGMPHSVDEVKVTAKKYQPVAEQNLRSLVDNVKRQLTDTTPVVDESKMNMLNEVYIWSTICLFAAQFCMVLGSSTLVSSVLRCFLTHPGTFVLLATLPIVTMLVMKVIVREESCRIVVVCEETRRIIVVSSTLISALLIGYLLNETVLPFWAPPMFVLPMCFTLAFPYFKSESLVQSREKQLMACLGSASLLHFMFALLFEQAHLSVYYLWMLCLIGFGFVDIQMKLRVSQFSVPIQQYLTSFTLLAVHFAFAYASGSPVRVPVAHSSTLMQLKS